jgi:hypothetical protein
VVQREKKPVRDYRDLIPVGGWMIDIAKLKNTSK